VIASVLCRRRGCYGDRRGSSSRRQCSSVSSSSCCWGCYIHRRSAAAAVEDKVLPVKQFAALAAGPVAVSSQPIVSSDVTETRHAEAPAVTTLAENVTEHRTSEQVEEGITEQKELINTQANEWPWHRYVCLPFRYSSTPLHGSSGARVPVYGRLKSSATDWFSSL